MPWLIVRLRGQSYALPSQEVRELVGRPQTTAVPDAPHYVPGVTNLRGRVLPVIDLRKRLGMAAASEESSRFIQLMEQRRQDHIKWLDELEASVRENRPFGLATDPHKCAFGRWYDSYKPDNGWIAALLRQFDKPHCKIHSAASEVHALQLKGDWDGCATLFQRTRTEVLGKMMKLFDNLQTLIRESEHQIGVVLQTGNHAYAVLVDEAAALEKFDPGSIGPLPLSTGDDIVTQVATRGKNAELILLIATERLVSEDRVAA
ncbi:MAG: chemotaxis protein CheW [Acidobacteria bacterium]|nr:chemotaxis protein CheW [Acidobacteriota bacterium]